MARWISKITNAGLELLARTPNNSFVFTKAECGSGTVDTSLLEVQTAIIDFKKALLISSCTNTNNQVKLRVQLNNENVATGFSLHQVGIYAKLSTDSTDILFMIIQTDLADFIPSVTESPNYVCDYVVNTVISNAASISANVDPAGYVTQGQLEEILAGLEDVELKDNVTQIKQDIGATADTGGGETCGTIFAKLNKIIQDILGMITNIGNANDTGATKTEGTIFGKLNEVMKSSLNTSARIVCCGVPGTQFVISNPSGYFEPKTVEISDNSYLLPSGHRAEFVGVPLGTYSIKISHAPLTSNTTTVSITADTLGKSYSFDYMLEVQRFTSSGVYTFPAETMYVTAAGGGGGGGGGDVSSKTYGGGGGGGGSCIYLYAFKKSVGFQTNITIGAGGLAGSVNVNGSAGKSTVLSNLTTLSGGGYGTSGSTTGLGGDGGIGGNGGGDGGACYNYGKNSIIPTGTGGTSVTNTNNSGGGGGGGFGAGGNGGSGTGVSGKDGGYGAGGGGGGKGAAGGAGGAGIVIFHLGFRQ